MKVHLRIMIFFKVQVLSECFFSAAVSFGSIKSDKHAAAELHPASLCLKKPDTLMLSTIREEKDPAFLSIKLSLSHLTSYLYFKKVYQHLRYSAKSEGCSSLPHFFFNLT